MSELLNPEKIFEASMAFLGSKTLLSAIELGVFSELSQGPTSFDVLSMRVEHLVGPDSMVIAIK